MTTKIEFLTIPVLPTSDIERDIVWYKEKMGLEVHFVDNMYAILYRYTGIQGQSMDTFAMAR